MKSLKMIIAATVLGSVSFGSMAATLLTKEDLDKNPGKYEKIGTVTTTAQTTSPMDAKDELSKLADEKGGQYYVIWQAASTVNSAPSLKFTKTSNKPSTARALRRLIVRPSAGRKPCCTRPAQPLQLPLRQAPSSCSIRSTFPIAAKRSSIACTNGSGVASDWLSCCALSAAKQRQCIAHLQQPGHQ